MITPYPPSLPLESIKLIVGKLRGTLDNDITKADLVHAGWEVSGYAFSQSIGNPGALHLTSFGTESYCDCTSEELCRHLEGCCDTTTVKLSVPWSAIAIKIAELVLKWILSK